MSLANTTQEAKHRQNNNVLNVNLTCCLDFMSSVTTNEMSYSFEQGLLLLRGTCRVADCVPGHP